jgi:hypothetical protein
MNIALQRLRGHLSANPGTSKFFARTYSPAGAFDFVDNPDGN